MSDTQTLERPKGRAAPKSVVGDFTIERDAFLSAIRTAGQVVESRNTIPVLSNLALKAEGERLTVLGTDLDMLSEIDAECTCTVPFATTVDAARLQTAVDTLRPGLISVKLEGSTLTLQQRSATRRLPTLPFEEFPVIQIGDISARFEMAATSLLALLSATAPSISTEATRYYLNGVYLHAALGNLRAASTDGHRLARFIHDLPAGAESLPDVLVARKGVHILMKLLADARDGSVVELEFSHSKMTAQVGRTRIVAKLIDGQFPDYERVIPQSNDKTLTVHATEFVRCVRAAAAVASERTRGIRLELSRDGSQAVGNSPEGGTAVEPIDGEFDAAELIIGVNARYAAEVGAIFGEAATLTVTFSDPTGPILFTSKDKPAISAVLMPMRA